jgi:hypothetical protein
MLLRAYIEKTGISISRLGKRVGVECRETMRKYVAGITQAPREVKERTAIETGGLVLPVDFDEAVAAYRASLTKRKKRAA